MRQNEQANKKGLVTILFVMSSEDLFSSVSTNEHFMKAVTPRYIEITLCLRLKLLKMLTKEKFLGLFKLISDIPFDRCVLVCIFACR